MLLEILILVLGLAAFFIMWGIQTKVPAIFSMGCIFVVVCGILLYATGLDTAVPTNTRTTKFMGVDGNTTYSTITTFQKLTMDNDKGLWAAAWSMIIIGFAMIPAGLYLLKQAQIPSINV